MSTSFNSSGILEALKREPLWVFWRYVNRPNQPKPAKVPGDPKTGQNADITDPTAWADFPTAEAYADQHGHGIGLVLTAEAGLCCIDLDATSDPGKRAVQQNILNAADAAGAYIERSPSGTGWHVWFQSDQPATAPRAVPGAEVYTHDRYITVNGRDSRGRLVPMPETLRTLLAPCFETLQEPTSFREHLQLHTVDDDEVIKQVRARYGARFEAFWRGEWEQFTIGDGSQSCADLEFAIQLARSTHDPEQWNRLFLSSGMAATLRERKKTERHIRQYLNRTYEKARQRADIEIHELALAEQTLQGLMQPSEDIDADGEFSIPIPKLRDEALYGILGEVTVAGSAHSEAVPSAIAANMLVRFCAALGPNRHVPIGDDPRSLRLFMIIVGPTSKGRKGTSAQLPSKIFSHVDQFTGWSLPCETRVSSGEGLVWMTRDPKYNFEGEMIDPGVLDKRMYLEISEFGGVFAQAKRESSVLTAIIRDAWDGRPLSTPNKITPCRASGAHFNIVGHITREELTKLLTNTDIKNGFANRFMMVYSARQKIVDDPQPTPASQVYTFAERITAALYAAWRTSFAPIELTPQAKARWIEIRRELESRPHTSDVASLMARADTYVRVLAAAIALINQEPEVGPQHLDAALAWVDHWEETANFCFTAAKEYDDMVLSKAVADEIVEAVRAIGGNRVPRTDVVAKVTNKNRRKDRDAKVIERAIAMLQEEAPPRIRIEISKSGKGRPKNLFTLLNN